MMGQHWVDMAWCGVDFDVTKALLVLWRTLRKHGAGRGVLCQISKRPLQKASSIRVNIGVKLEFDFKGKRATL